MPRRILTGEAFAAAFWARVAGPDSRGCRLWTGSMFREGYGSVRAAGKNRGAHVVAFELAIGPVPPGLSVLHKCSVKACVEPSHLFAGTQAESMALKVAKERQARGETNGNARLTEAEVLEIRSRDRHGEARDDLAAKFGVSPVTVYDVTQRRTWRHI